MSIPKIIHYAWFGRGEKNELAKKCIKSWEKQLSDYQLIEWNEDNFDFSKYPFAKAAYAAKKYAYVSDVVRLAALYEYGGVYMDTDVEVIKPLDVFLTHNGFSGFQDYKEIPTGTMASEKGNKWVKDQLNYYKTAVFSIDEINIGHITNVDIITKISLEKHGLILNNKKQELKYGMMIYPMDYFCAKSPTTGKIIRTSNTYTIHHFAGSWVPKKARRNKKIIQIMRRILGDKVVNSLYKGVKGK